VVYGRTIAGRTLDFEPSGALLQASLVMRDRQTDSWWSIMSSDAIGGPLEGTDLPELPAGEKTTWREWRAKHPGTLVLSVDGVEHVAGNPYDRYLATRETFRDVASPDDRLPPKEPIFAFRLDGRPWAIPHRAVAGGRLVDLPGDRRRLLLFRERGASLYASTEAWLVEPAAGASAEEPAALRAAAKAGKPGFSRLEGFDTFWYTWAGVNRATGVLR
jgi:hypothetical protein